MARSVAPKSGPSRIRFVMLEADVQDGDLSQITQAIQNAFRSPVATRATPQPRMISVDPVTAFQPEHDEVVEGDVERPSANVSESVGKTTRKKTVAKTPDVLNDIDTETAPSLKEFVSQFDIKTGVDKYLVITLWFRDARSTNAVTVDHVYTCFRLLGWSTASSDFSKPLRNLRDEQSMSRRC